MDKTTLVSIIQSHRRDSLGYESGDLSKERAEAMDHYHGRPYGNEVTGRSQVVSRDLAETVDWALPAIMRAFVQSGNLAEFSPIGPDDEALARQETDYTNQVIMRDNPGFMILHDAIKDTLLLKNGYVKHWWNEEEKVEDEDLSGLTMDQIAKLDADLKAEGAELVIKAQESRYEMAPGMPEMGPAAQIMANPADHSMAGMVELFDLEVQIKRKVCGVKIEACPSEEVRVSKRCRGSLQDSPFTEHVTLKTRSELIQMGMPRSFVDELPAYRSDENSNETLARDSLTDESLIGESLSLSDRSMDEIEFCEAYVRVDYDGDGIAELRKVVTVANQIPPGEEWNEAVPAVAITGFVMKRVPHRHVGESFDDEIKDIQVIKTALERQLMDNLYRVNNSRVVANERVNQHDLMTSTPGGVVRVRGDGPIGDSLEPLVTPPILDKILPAIDYWDKVKEVRSGIRPGSDMDPEVLREVTKGAFMENMNRLSQKIEMITRMLAESGVKDLVLQVHDLLIRHQDRPRTVQMRGKWVEVDPRTWKSRTDLSLKVGLGTGNEEEKRQKLGMLSQFQGQLLQAAVAAPPPVYSRMYSLFEDMAQTLGVDNPEKYAIAPNSDEYKQMQQAKGQQQDPALAKAQIDAQVKMRTEEMRAHFQQLTDQNRQAAEMQQHRDRMEMEGRYKALEAHYQQLDAMRDQQFQRWKAELDAAVKVQVANITSKAKVDDAATQAATGEIASDVRPNE